MTEVEMAKKNVVEMRGRVLEVLPSAMYRVELENGHLALATVAGRARRGLRVIKGDSVMMELSPYDLTRGRITGRGQAHGGAGAAEEKAKT
jgi:translation initiation factor IF-1